MSKFGIVIHGGAGAISKEKMTPALEGEYRLALHDTVNVGYDILANGGTSLDATEAAVRFMENSPLFNAGRGAVFTNAETHEMDAAIMDGRERLCGAIAGVRGVKNPVSLARLVMEKSDHVLLARDGAEIFARIHNVEFADKEYFHTDRRWQQLQKLKGRSGAKATELSEGSDPDEGKYGTVGAVALDQSGNLAAATSTGGMTNTKYGRVGDTPIIGAGTFADNATAAISATGQGEYIIRGVVAHDICALMKYQGHSLEVAAKLCIMEGLKGLGGDGGVVAIDAKGNFTMPFNCPGMYRGYKMQGSDEPFVAIWET